MILFYILYNAILQTRLQIIFEEIGMLDFNFAYTISGYVHGRNIDFS